MPEIQPRLYEYIGGVIRGEQGVQGVLYALGGTPDHLHLLLRWRTDAAPAELMRRLKGGSSRWVHDTFPRMRSFGWQEGYGIFSVSQSNRPEVEQYINNQAQHHRRRTFQEEYLEFLKKNEIEFDPRYIWD